MMAKKEGFVDVVSLEEKISRLSARVEQLASWLEATSEKVALLSYLVKQPTKNKHTGLMSGDGVTPAVSSEEYVIKQIQKLGK